MHLSIKIKSIRCVCVSLLENENFADYFLMHFAHIYTTVRFKYNFY